MSSYYHVVPSREGGWAVRRSGSARASRLFSTERAAIEYARQTARKEHTNLFVHLGDGTVTNRESYTETIAVPDLTKH